MTDGRRRSTISGSSTSCAGASTWTVEPDPSHGETSGGRPDSLSIAATPLGRADSCDGAAEFRPLRIRELRSASPG